jgi:hypothetical protein
MGWLSAPLSMMRPVRASATGQHPLLDPEVIKALQAAVSAHLGGIGASRGSTTLTTWARTLAASFAVAGCPCLPSSAPRQPAEPCSTRSSRALPYWHDSLGLSPPAVVGDGVIHVPSGVLFVVEAERLRRGAARRTMRTVFRRHRCRSYRQIIRRLCVTQPRLPGAGVRCRIGGPNATWRPARGARLMPSPRRTANSRDISDPGCRRTHPVERFMDPGGGQGIQYGNAIRRMVRDPQGENQVLRRITGHGSVGCGARRPGRQSGSARRLDAVRRQGRR